MIAWKLRHWRAVGAAAALSLAACGGEGGEGGQGATGDGGEAGEGGDVAAVAPATPAEAGEAGEAAIGEGGGEHGEAGVVSAYAGLSGDQLTALRIQHLRGFVMAAEQIVQDGSAGGEPSEAAILVQQGMLEVYDSAPDGFNGLDVTALREAATGFEYSRPQMQQRLRASQDALDAAMAGLDVDEAGLVARLVDIAAGLYQHVLVDGVADPIEYVHSHGAALAARNLLVLHQDELRQRNLLAYSRSLGELNRFTALWPGRLPSDNPSTYQQVVVQASRVRLALSPYL
jgi:hypothetical protein